MKNLNCRYIALLIILFLLSSWHYAQESEIGYEPGSRILFIFDASYSMSGPWDGETKINIARKVLAEMVDSIAQLENVEMALRVYGHQSPVPPQDCSDTKLEVPFAPNNASRIRQKLRFLSPKGTTPIAHSLELAANDFPPCNTCRNIIILLTDGVEACDGDPCEVSLELQKKGITLRPFVIGIGNDPMFEETFGCLGHYYDAPSKEQFRHAMKVVITHTLNSKGNPDTLSIDQLSTYDVVAQTIPSASIDSVRLVAGRHNHIGIDAPQGYLLIRSAKGSAYRNEKILVKRSGDPTTINVQFMETSEKYVVGKYDLEIPVFPLIYLRDLEIRQSYTTTVEVPEPGMVHIASKKPGYGALFQLTPEGDQKWILNIRSGVIRQDYYRQPGSYRIVYRQANVKNTMQTQVRDFGIRSGLTELVEFR